MRLQNRVARNRLRLGAVGLVIFSFGTGCDESNEHESHQDPHASNPNAHEPHQDAHEAHQDEHAHQEDHDESEYGLTLDEDGTKWALDAHSRTVFQEMHQTAGGTADSLAAATAIGDALKALLTQLISGCTMDGPAHDALHDLLG